MQISKQNLVELANKALGLFRVAQASSDPFKAIDSYFSCIHAVLKDQSNPISPASDFIDGILLGILAPKCLSRTLIW